MARKDYTLFDKEDLIKIIEKLESRRKYGLIWDEEMTKEQFEKESENALPVLDAVNINDINTDIENLSNVLIEGDNYHALAVLNYTHQSKIDVIYIDPPYNTGKKKEWKYNDKWVNKEDTYKHSKWLSFISKRLKLAKNLLKETGIILVSIDENEIAQLKLILDDIFGESNLLQMFVWNTEGNIDNQKKIKSNHEYILAYAKNETCFEAPAIIDPNIGQNSKLYKDTIENSIIKNGPKNPVSEIELPIGFPATIESGIIKSKKSGWPIIANDVEIKNYKTINVTKVKSGWSSKDLLIEYINNNYHPIKDNKEQDTWFKITNTGAIYGYKSRSQNQSHVLSVLTNFGTTKKSSEELKRMGVSFSYPKPIGLIEYLIQLHNSKHAVVLDFFAGSGTTGHAVLSLNSKNKESERTFILCTNNEENICTEVCYPRLRNAINGYKSIKGLGGSLKYFKSSFVKKTINRDDLKNRITQKCTEMLCLKEGIYNEVTSNINYRIFKQQNRIMGVYYAIDPVDLKDLKRDLDNMEGEKVLYCFTLDSAGLDKNDFSTWQNVKLEPIPQKILDIYEQIYER